MPICLGPDLPIRMVFALRYVAVAISVVLHAISGVCLVSYVLFLSRMSSQPRPFSHSSQSILAVILQYFFPFLKQLPPSFYFDHTSAADLSHHHFPRRRDSGYSTHSTTSDSASDESSELRLSISEPDPNGCLDDHFTLLLASQARARAARHPQFTLSSSLWTLKEYPSPYLPQVGEERGSTAIPPDRLCDSSSIASSELSTPPQEERFSEKSRKSSTTSKHSRSSHGHPFRLLPFHRRGSRSLSPSPGQSRRTSPPLPEVANPPRRASSSSRNDQDHSRSSVLGYGAAFSPSEFQGLISPWGICHNSTEGRAWAQGPQREETQSRSRGPALGVSGGPRPHRPISGSILLPQPHVARGIRLCAAGPVQPETRFE